MRFLRRPVLAGLLVLSACGGSSGSGGDVAAPAADRATATTSAASAPDASAPAGSELLAFKAPAIGGGEVDASIHQGRPTLLWFWAPW